MAVQGVILDVDGTLVLSNDAHAQAWVEAFAAFGYDVPFEQVRPLIGMGGDQVIPRVTPELNDKDGDGQAILKKRRELMVNHYAPTLAPAKGARELVLKMQQSGLKLIVASSSTKEELSKTLKVAEVDDLLDQITPSSEVKATKPSPDIVQAALSQLEMEPNQVVMLADTPYDIEAASKCGVGVIAVRCGGFNDTQLAGAIAIYNDPADVLANYTKLFSI